MGKKIINGFGTGRYLKMLKLLVYHLTGLTTKINRFIKQQVKIYRFIQEIDSYKALQEKYNYKVVVLYHARCEVGAETWLRIMQRVKRQPTIDSINEVFNDD